MKKIKITKLILLVGVFMFSLTNLSGQSFPQLRPESTNRNFVSEPVEKKIAQMQNAIKDPELAWMFGNCFPNTLDRTVNFINANGKPDTFVITGDIFAMWLRDSSA